MALSKNPLRNLHSWIVAYEKINGPPTIIDVKDKIKQLLVLEKVSTDKKSSKIYFRDSQWSVYVVLRDELIKDRCFVRDYKGVDLKAYIEEALAWSEKGNLSTDMGWKLTLKNWMRKARSEGKLIMLPVTEKTGFSNH